VIDVAISPGSVPPADVAVVIDVLRATSTITAALAAGYETALCADSVERAMGLRRAGRVLAGERHCVMPEGFDQGNSPADASSVRGSELVLATTNGAPAIVRACRNASKVYVGCLLNLDAVVAILLGVHDPESEHVVLVCAGTDGAVALEDVYAAGRIAARVSGPRTDAARVAEGVAQACRSPLSALQASADAAVLRRVGLAVDIADCAKDSTLEAVGEARACAAGVAAVTLVGSTSATARRRRAGDAIGV
jgi:2-phosphosulfolactate phosphatase